MSPKGNADLLLQFTPASHSNSGYYLLAAIGCSVLGIVEQFPNGYDVAGVELRHGLLIRAWRNWGTR